MLFKDQTIDLNAVHMVGRSMRRTGWLDTYREFYDSVKDRNEADDSWHSSGIRNT